MAISSSEVPVAVSMLQALKQLQQFPDQSLQKFLLYWIAFNNIYTTLADQNGLGRRVKQNEEGEIQVREIANMRIPVVAGSTEREQLDFAFDLLSDELKHLLIVHESARFFTQRTPMWGGKKIETDELGQCLNGVINVGYTVNSRCPVWSPVNKKLYEAYLNGDINPADRDTLSRQIFNLIYVVRNNAFHGGKRMDDANDSSVLQAATPLLALVVHFFVPALELELHEQAAYGDPQARAG